MDSMTNKTIRGMKWAGIESVAQHVVSLAVGILLARILVPADYGIIAVLAIFIAFGQTLSDAGFSSAVIREYNPSQSLLSTAFWINISIGILGWLFIWGMSVPLAKFYSQPVLADVAPVLALVLPINALGLIPSAKFANTMDFRSPMIASFGSNVISGIIAIIMAVNNYGIWSIVGQQCICAFCRTSWLWLKSGWLPCCILEKQSLYKLTSFGLPLLFSRMLNSIYTNIYPFFIGLFYSAPQLGYYAKARSYASLPPIALSEVLTRVSLPALSAKRDNRELLHQSYMSELRIVSFFVFPMMAFFVTIAHPLTIILLTDKWEGMVWFFQLFAVMFMLYPIHALNLNVLLVNGESPKFFRLEIYKTLIGLSLLAITLKWGILSICIGQLIGGLCALFINTKYSSRTIGIGIQQQLRLLSGPFIASCLSAIVAMCAGSAFDNEWCKLIVCILVGVLGYLLLAKIFRMKGLIEIKKVIANVKE